MLLTTIFSLPANLCLDEVCLENEVLTLVLKSSQASAVCPECTEPSTRIRGRYTRTLADLPCQGRAVRVRLEMRRFVCRTRGCPRTTFAECFPQLTRAYARRTLRQAEALTEVAFANGGKAGARLAKRLAMPTSRATLLRFIRSTAAPQYKTRQVLGLNDFAWKKGDRYGTLLVDLQAHCPVEVLPDREADTVVRWLRAHRGVKIISRDRAGAYAEAATRGAPRAKQVADRYHILVNLRDAIKGTLARKSGSLPEMIAERGEPHSSFQSAMGSLEASRAPDGTAPEDERAGAPQDQREASGARPLTVAEQRRQISRANRLVRYEQIIALHRQGLSQRAIARQLHVSRKVVHRSVSAGTFPERTPTGKRQSKLDPFLPYLRKRWGRAVTTACNSHVNCGSKDFADQPRWSASSLVPGEHAYRIGGAGARQETAGGTPCQARLTPRQASWLFVKDQAQFTTDQRALTQRICHTNADLQELYQLGQDFVQMVKQRQARRLDGWLARAQQSSSVELRGFASGIKRDYAAVKAALSLPWSQGQVEGHITRLKFLKRQMYGRAQFDVLRSRVLRRA